MVDVDHSKISTGLQPVPAGSAETPEIRRYVGLRSFICNTTPLLFLSYWPACSVRVATLPVRQESRDDPEALVHLGLPDHRASQVDPDRLVLQETPEFPANRDCPSRLSLLQLRLLVNARASTEFPIDQGLRKR